MVAIYHLYFIKGRYLHSTSSSYLLTDPPGLILLEAQAFHLLDLKIMAVRFIQ